MGRIGAVVVVLILFGACSGSDPNVTESGKGKPLLGVTFPEEAEAGSQQDAVISVSNPGPGEIGTLVIAFALVGPAQGSSELPTPLVTLGVGGRNPSIEMVDPAPSAVSDNGTVYTFGPPDGGSVRLAEGDSMTVTFTIRVPEGSGEAANSLQVYDGSALDRVSGLRLTTLIRQ